MPIVAGVAPPPVTSSHDTAGVAAAVKFRIWEETLDRTATVAPEGTPLAPVVSAKGSEPAEISRFVACGLIRIERPCVTVDGGLEESEIDSVNGYVPDIVGVPAICPLVSEIPGGSERVEIAKE